MLEKSIIEIERERQRLQTQEKKLITEIKKTAKQGQMGAVKVIPKDLIRTRHQIEKVYSSILSGSSDWSNDQADESSFSSGNRARVSEVMGVSIDDALEEDEEEQDTLTRSLVNAPSGAVAAPVAKNKVVQVEAAGA
ncbi:unnamed protein product [Eruca vesicaria subsp. sativa]|uniref:Uncharacterized protein n=1 Tax=Eruca vesicaria subsp. sativa TaxID=29727 RepID=A0ABC8KA10_ERUVS|nr:unnamed protein product [Eruca vesicaria subsp. sativa]